MSQNTTISMPVNGNKPNQNLVRQWFLTDDKFAQQFAQHCIKIDDFTFGFAEIRKAAGNSFSLCHAVIDLRDYAQDELERYTSVHRGFYESLDEIAKTYGAQNASLIIAKCVFEETESFQMDYCINFDSRDEATAKLPKYLEIFVPQK